MQRQAAACIFLAAKVEEAAVRTNDMLNAVAAAAAAAAPVAHVGIGPTAAMDGVDLATFPCLVGEAYQQRKAQLILDEQLLLRVLRFDIGVDQPHRHLYVLAHCWGATSEAVRAAVCLLNDCVCSCPIYGSDAMPPAAAAAAALHLGAQLSGQALQAVGWWRATGISDEAMQRCCTSLLDLVGA